jgi:hypothetical protein
LLFPGPIAAATAPSVSLFTIGLFTAARLALGPTPLSGPAGLARFSALTLRGSLLFVLSRLRLLPALLTATGGAPLLTRLRLTLLRFVLLRLVLLRSLLLRPA